MENLNFLPPPPSVHDLPSCSLWNLLGLVVGIYLGYSHGSLVMQLHENKMFFSHIMVRLLCSTRCKVLQDVASEFHIGHSLPAYNIIQFY